MCENFRPTKRKSVVGYKVLMRHKKTRRHHSTFTGFIYPKDGSIPVWKRQGINKAQLWNDIFKDENMREAQFDKEMIGRTSAFIDSNQANKLKGTMKMTGAYLETFGGFRVHHRSYSPPSQFIVIVVKVKLTVDLLLADYNGDTVYCGRHMEIIGEVK